MDNNQLPIGLGLSLAMNQKAMDRFSGMTEAEKERTIAKSRGVKSAFLVCSNSILCVYFLCVYYLRV